MTVINWKRSHSANEWFEKTKQEKQEQPSKAKYWVGCILFGAHFIGLDKMQHSRTERYLCGILTPFNETGKTFQKGQKGVNKSPEKEKVSELSSSTVFQWNHVLSIHLLHCLVFTSLYRNWEYEGMDDYSLGLQWHFCSW